jgi:integrase
VRLDDAAAEYLAGMKAGRIKTRSGEPYKASTIRSYEHTLNLHALPDLGARQIGSITTGDLQALVERMSGDGQTGSTTSNVINPVRSIFRRLRVLGHVSTNPTQGVVIPRSSSKRLHAGDPADAERVIAAMPEQDQCVWALSFWAGLRLGELRGLRWRDVDAEAGVIHVRRPWDRVEGETLPKSSAGVRDVPILARLTPYLKAQRAACAWSDDPDGLVLGSTRRAPFAASPIYILAVMFADQVPAYHRCLASPKGIRTVRVLPHLRRVGYSWARRRQCSHFGLAGVHVADVPEPSRRRTRHGFGRLGTGPSREQGSAHERPGDEDRGRPPEGDGTAVDDRLTGHIGAAVRAQIRGRRADGDRVQQRRPERAADLLADVHERRGNTTLGGHHTGGRRVRRGREERAQAGFARGRSLQRLEGPLGSGNGCTGRDSSSGTGAFRPGLPQAAPAVAEPGQCGEQ